MQDSREFYNHIMNSPNTDLIYSADDQSDNQTNEFAKLTLSSEAISPRLQSNQKQQQSSSIRNSKNDDIFDKSHYLNSQSTQLNYNSLSQSADQYTEDIYTPDYIVSWIYSESMILNSQISNFIKCDPKYIQEQVYHDGMAKLKNTVNKLDTQLIDNTSRLEEQKKMLKYSKQILKNLDIRSKELQDIADQDCDTILKLSKDIEELKSMHSKLYHLKKNPNLHENIIKRSLLGEDGEDEFQTRLKMSKELLAANRRRAELEDRIYKMEMLDFEDPESLAILNQLKEGQNPSDRHTFNILDNAQKRIEGRETEIILQEKDFLKTRHQTQQKFGLMKDQEKNLKNKYYERQKLKDRAILHRERRELHIIKNENKRFKPAMKNKSSQNGSEDELIHSDLIEDEFDSCRSSDFVYSKVNSSGSEITNKKNVGSYNFKDIPKTRDLKVIEVDLLNIDSSNSQSNVSGNQVQFVSQEETDTSKSDQKSDPNFSKKNNQKAEVGHTKISKRYSIKSPEKKSTLFAAESLTKKDKQTISTITRSNEFSFMGSGFSKIKSDFISGRSLFGMSYAEMSYKQNSSFKK